MPMRSDLFCQLAHVINESYGWIRVSEAKTYAVRSVRIRCRTYPIASRTLMLRAAFSHRRYPKGSVWQIAEHDLDKAIAKYRKQNPDFKARLYGKDDSQGAITADDAEQIIRLATHGLLNLELSDTLL